MFFVIGPFCTPRGWFRALIWGLIELCRVKKQPKVPPWLASRAIFPNCGQDIRVLWWFFAQFTMLMCSDSIFNLLKRVTDASFLFSCWRLVFLFLPFLNLGTKIKFPQIWYTDAISAFDQPLTYDAPPPSCLHFTCLNIGFWQVSFVWKCCIFSSSTFN